MPLTWINYRPDIGNMTEGAVEGLVSRIFNFRLSSSSELKKRQEEEKSDGPPLNPINELQILEGHTDIVRILLKIDEQR